MDARSFILAIAVATLCAPASRAHAADNVVFFAFSNDAQLDGPTFAAAKAAALQELERTAPKVQDISETCRALFMPGMLAPTFDRPVPSALDAATAADWSAAQKACAERMKRFAADPHAARALTSQRAVQCQMEATKAVFARLLERERPARVVKVQVLRERGGPGTARIVVTVIDRAAGTANSTFEDVPFAAIPEKVAGVVAHALAGNGTTEPWKPSTALPDAELPASATRSK